jgi:hypothetical protein
MTTRHLAVVVGAVILVGGCTSLGWRFGPGFSCTNGALFESPPVVVHQDGEYFLEWTQGTHPFFFEPNYRAMDGCLVFAVAATASSGSLAGRHRQMKIEGPENLGALRRGGAFWWERDPEPDGRLVALRLVNQEPPR